MIAAGPMHVPGLMERVRLGGLDEMYLVTHVNHEAQIADLMPIVFGKDSIQSVPFQAIESIPGCSPPLLKRSLPHAM